MMPAVCVKGPYAVCAGVGVVPVIRDDHPGELLGSLVASVWTEHSY